MNNSQPIDFNRRNLNFWNPRVVEILPEHYRGDYPKLIQLLEAYSNFMDSDGNVNDDFRQMLRVRDIEGASLEFLEYLYYETCNGLKPSQFTDPRSTARFMPDFYSFKGSNFSARAFFRAVYGEEVEIQYPKDNIFIVGESRIGVESLKYIQDGALYQILSILIKSSKPISIWREQYKQFVHPAGFYLGGEVLIETSVSVSPTVEFYFDSNDDGAFTIEDAATIAFSLSDETLTTLIESDGTEMRIDTSRTGEEIGTDSAGAFLYDNPYEYSAANYRKLDDSGTGGMDFSTEIETFDRSNWDSNSV